MQFLSTMDSISLNSFCLILRSSTIASITRELFEISSRLFENLIFSRISLFVSLFIFSFSTNRLSILLSLFFEFFRDS